MKTHFFTALTAALCLASCSDDDAPINYENGLVGTWKVVAWYNDTPVDIDGDGTASTDLFAQWNGCYKTSTLTLNANGTTNMTYTGLENNPTCWPGMQTNDSWDYLPWQIDPADDEYPYTALEFIGDDYYLGFEIEELTETTLVLRGAGLYVYDGFTDGYLKFERQ